MICLHELIPSAWCDSALPENLELSDITADSREIEPQSLFVAVAGLSVDGRDYIEKAISAGAVAVVYETESLSAAQEEVINSLVEKFPHVPMLAIDKLNEKVGYLASEFFGNPSQSMSVFGITGTNGKTSCAYLMAQSLQLLGFNSAFIGTIGWGDIKQLHESTHTTPDAINLQRQLAMLLSEDYTHVCMEVSSHALDQGRVTGVEFYGAMFTNLSHEHLDYHKTMGSYAAAKRRLFTDFNLKFVVTNNDDEFGAGLIDVSSAEFIASYGQSGDVRCEDLVASRNGLSMTIESESLDFDVETSLVGLVNVPNILLVATTLLVLGVDTGDIHMVVKQLQPAPGRMEMFATDAESQLPITVVDYAHTPDALQRALLSCREHCAGDLWVVFGCGGDRDQEKRPKMGAIADEFADHAVITSDNSRSEKNANIFAAIQQGMASSATQIEDRATAIEWALNQAGSDDWVLVAGKGHETTQINQAGVTPFSDRQWVEQCLESAA